MPLRGGRRWAAEFEWRRRGGAGRHWAPRLGGRVSTLLTRLRPESPDLYRGFKNGNVLYVGVPDEDLKKENIRRKEAGFMCMRADGLRSKQQTSQ